jgi:pimeloyl-[acyl-carrier protein] methyl ester esterase
MTSILQHRILGSVLPDELPANVENNLPHIVLLHGWGLNSGVFDQVAPLLAETMRVQLIDLPGFGYNAAIPLTELEETVAQLASVIPDNAIILGWSLGGLLAQQLALSHPQKVLKLITVASTPHFMAVADTEDNAKQSNWLGIAPKVLLQFETQLARDYQKTVQRFLAIQAMGSVSAKHDMQALKQAIEAYPAPCEASLLQGLKLLQQVDLRAQIGMIQQPTLRVYGRLDSLVPQRAVAAIQVLQPHANSVVMEHVSHAPFISNKVEFCDIIMRFVNA